MQVEHKIDPKKIAWHYTMYPARLGFVDYKIVAVLFIFLLWPALITFSITMVIILFLAIASHMGLNPMSALRSFRYFIAGKKTAWHLIRYRKSVNYQNLLITKAKFSFLFVCLLFPQTADASFTYIPPYDLAENNVLTIQDSQNGITLIGQLKKILPEGTDIQFEQNVDANFLVPSEIRDWKTLLHYQNLEWLQRGDVIQIFPPHIPTQELKWLEKNEHIINWQVKKGTYLRDVFEEWGSKAGIEITFLTDYQYRINQDRQITGTFSEAVRKILFSMGHLSHPPIGELVNGESQLLITNR